MTLTLGGFCCNHGVPHKNLKTGKLTLIFSKHSSCGLKPDSVRMKHVGAHSAPRCRSRAPNSETRRPAGLPGQRRLKVSL